MAFTRGVRKLTLTIHVAVTLGWLGAVFVFLALSIIGLTSQDVQTVRGAYLVMEPVAWFVLVPLAVGSLLTGVVLSLGTTWGLFRHYWVVFKLVITAVALLVLLLYMPTFRSMAESAADLAVGLEVVRNPSPALHAALAIAALIVAAVLGTYKPRGLTPFGHRTLKERGTSKHVAGVGCIDAPAAMSPRWVKVIVIITAIIVVKLVLLTFVRAFGVH